MRPVWHLRAPVLAALFQEVAAPNRLQLFDLVEVLDWTAAALDRVDREAFFPRFSEGEAVPYFYEPFLEAFDPALRKQLGVWYTPKRSRALYGRPRGQGAERRPRYRGRPRGGKRLCLGPLLRHGGLLGRSAAANRRES